MEKHDASVSEMVRDAAPDKTFHDELDGHLADYNVSRTLCALRCSQNMTQEGLAKRAGCTQSKISRIENSRNDRLKLDDLAIYARAFNMQVSIDFAQESSTADAIGRLARQITSGLDAVAEKVRHDGTADDGAKKPYEEFLFNMLDLFMDNLEGFGRAATARRIRERRRGRVTADQWIRWVGAKRRAVRDGITALQDSEYTRQSTSAKRTAGPNPARPVRKWLAEIRPPSKGTSTGSVQAAQAMTTPLFVLG